MYCECSDLNGPNMYDTKYIRKADRSMLGPYYSTKHLWDVPRLYRAPCLMVDSLPMLSCYECFWAAKSKEGLRRFTSCRLSTASMETTHYFVRFYDLRDTRAFISGETTGFQLEGL